MEASTTPERQRLASVTYTKLLKSTQFHNGPTDRDVTEALGHVYVFIHPTLLPKTTEQPRCLVDMELQEISLVKQKCTRLEQWQTKPPKAHRKRALVLSNCSVHISA